MVNLCHLLRTTEKGQFTFPVTSQTVCLFSSKDVMIAAIAAPDENPTMPTNGPSRSSVLSMCLIDRSIFLILPSLRPPYPQTHRSFPSSLSGSAGSMPDKNWNSKVMSLSLANSWNALLIYLVLGSKILASLCKTAWTDRVHVA